MEFLDEVSSTVFAVPRSHHHCRFSNFTWPSIDVQLAVTEFLQEILAGDCRHLIVTGTPGLGKTHLSVAIYRWAVLRWGTVLCTLVHVPDIFARVKAVFDDPSAPNPFLEIEGARKLVVLDDVLGRTPTPWEIDHVIFRLINTVHTNSASLVLTTNQTIDQIAQVLKPHEVSRLLEKAVHLEFKGLDRRL